MIWPGGAPGSDGRRRLGIEPPVAGPVRVLEDGASSVGGKDIGSVRTRSVRAVVLHGRDDDGRPGRRIEGRAPVAAGLTRARPGSPRLWVDGRVRSRRHACRRRSCCVASGRGCGISRGRGDVIRVVGIQGSISANSGQRDPGRVVEGGGPASRRIPSISISHGVRPGHKTMRPLDKMRKAGDNNIKIVERTQTESVLSQTEQKQVMPQTHVTGGCQNPVTANRAMQRTRNEGSPSTS